MCNLQGHRTETVLRPWQDNQNNKVVLDGEGRKKKKKKKKDGGEKGTTIKHKTTVKSSPGVFQLDQKQMGPPENYILLY